MAQQEQKGSTMPPKKKSWWAFWKKSGSAGSPTSPPKKKPWWAFWRKSSETQSKPPKLSQTGEIPALQWDVKTVPAARQPVIAPPMKAAPPPKAAPSSQTPGQPPSSSPVAGPQAKSASPPASASAPPATTSTGDGFAMWMVVTVGLLVLYSTPFWVTPWPPMSETPAQIGLIAYQQQAVNENMLLPWQSSSLVYIGRLSDMVLTLWVRLFPASVALSLWMQCWMLLMVFSLAWMLQSAEISRWNLLLTFPFFSSGALYACDIHFFLALPFVCLGLGALYRWLLKNQSMSGLFVVLISWLLPFLHAEAYMLFLVMALASCVIWSQGWTERLSHLLLPGSSLILLIPWWFLASGTSITNKAPWVWGDVREKVLALWDTPLLSTYDGWTDFALLALVVLFWLGLLLFSSTMTTSSGASEKNKSPGIVTGMRFFATLGLVMFGVYMLIPQQGAGYTWTTTAPLVILYLGMAGWLCFSVHHLMGRVLLVAVVLVLGGYGYHIFRSHRAYGQEVQQLQTLLGQVPPKGNLLVWSVPASRVFRISHHQAGGYWMILAKGFSNLQLHHHLKWNTVSYHPQHQLPSPFEPKLPTKVPYPGATWHYLLTGQTLPTSVPSSWTLVAKGGLFRLYRRVL